MSDCNKPTALNHAVMVTQNVLTAILVVVILIREAIKIQKDLSSRPSASTSIVYVVVALPLDKFLDLNALKCGLFKIVSKACVLRSFFLAFAEFWCLHPPLPPVFAAQLFAFPACLCLHPTCPCSTIFHGACLRLIHSHHPLDFPLFPTVYFALSPALSLPSRQTQFTLAPHSMVLMDATSSAFYTPAPHLLVLVDAHATKFSLQMLRTRWCSKMLLPPHSIHLPATAGARRCCCRHIL